MKIPQPLYSGLLLFVAPLALGAAVLLRDDFSSPVHPQRALPARADWKLADGTATATFNRELFEKNKSHGGVVWYNLRFDDAVLRYSFRPSRATTIAFTANADSGHAFRFIQQATGEFRMLTWDPKSTEHKAISLLAPGDKGPPLVEGKWTEVELRFSGQKCTVKIGDWVRTYEHPGIAVTKKQFGIHGPGSAGAFSVRNVTMETLPKSRS